MSTATAERTRVSSNGKSKTQLLAGNAADCGEIRVSLPPNGMAIQSMRHSGHSDEAAIGDIVDNAVDSKAKKIGVVYDGKSIAITDDGSGMDYDTLLRALTLGPSGNRTQGFLGTFGLGLKIAATSRGRRFEVTTKEVDGELLHAIYDIDEISNVDSQWVVRIKKTVNPQSIKSFEHKVGGNSGTIVKITKLDLMSSKSKQDFHRKVMSYVGRIYCRIIEDGDLSFTVDGVKVNPLNPMEPKFEERSAKINGCLNYMSETIVVPAGTIFFESVAIGFDHDIDFEEGRKTGSWRDYMDLHPNQMNSGVYVYRNGREIAHVPLTYFGHRTHPSQNYLRFSISFDEQLDGYFNVPHTKDRINVPDSFTDSIRGYIALRCKHVNDAYKSRNVAKSEVAKEADEEIQMLVGRAENNNLIHRPKVNVRPPRKTADKTDESEDKKPKDDKSKSNTPGRKPVSVTSMMATPEYSKRGKGGRLCEHSIDGQNRIHLVFNTDHDFYAKYYGDKNDVSGKAHHAAYSAFMFALKLSIVKLSVDNASLEPIFDDLEVELGRVLKNIAIQR